MSHVDVLGVMDFNDSHVRSLVAKVEGLALSEQEQAALSALVDAAELADGDVAGFGAGFPIGMRMFNVLGVGSSAGANPDGVQSTAGGSPDGVVTYTIND